MQQPPPPPSDSSLNSQGWTLLALLLVSSAGTASLFPRPGPRGCRACLVCCPPSAPLRTEAFSSYGNGPFLGLAHTTPLGSRLVCWFVYFRVAH